MRHIFVNSTKRLTCVIVLLGFILQLQAQPQISGSDLVCNGESFFAASNICSELTRLARADGVIPQGESFRQIAVSGAPISSIINQYKGCNPKPTYLVSDGAGIDLMSSSDVTGLGNKLQQYLEEMRNNDTKKLLWMIYPDPQGGSWATLKKNQDLWAEQVPKIMAEVTRPEVYLVDLRDTWESHYNEYTSDGIHCTDAGGTATAEAFWEVMKADNYAFFDTSSGTVSAKYISQRMAKTTPLLIVSKIVENRKIVVLLSNDHPSDITLQLTTVSGRRVLKDNRRVTGSGQKSITFPIGSIASGVYCCRVISGKAVIHSTLLVP